MKLVSNDPVRPRRRRHVLCALPLLCLVMLPVSAQGAASPRRDVLVHAAGRYSDKSPIWIAMVEAAAKDSQTEKTIVLAREGIGEKKWQQFSDTPARAVGLTSHGTELVVMLAGKPSDRRGWAWFSERFSYGPPLPAGMRLLTMAGDVKTLYALGAPAIAPAGPTRPATAATALRGDAAAAAPATRPSQPTLYVLDGDTWKPFAAHWPKEAAGAEDLASLHVIDGAPHLAAPAGEGVVRVYRLSTNPAAAWVQTDEVKVDIEPRFVKLLNADERPALWVQTDAVGGLWSRKHPFAKLQFSGVLPKPEEVDVTVASDVRLFFRREGKPYEMHFNWDGSASGPATVLDWTRPRTDPTINWITTAFMTVLAVLLVSTLLRRRSMTKEDERGEPEE